jgi:catechol 2,3-dioxygenase-like lactoylglutathione lyase family enzyme
MKVAHIGIYAKDVDKLAQWYQDVLKMKVVRKLERVGRPPVYFLKTDEGSEIEILPATKEGCKRELQESGYSHVGIEVDNFDEFTLYLKSRGITVYGVRITSHGWKIGYIEDIEGNIIEIIEK